MLFDDSIDLLEDDVVQYEKKLLDILLIDRTSRKNIIWATDDYCNLGERFGKTNEILPNQITEKYSMLIQPRSSKSKNEQIMRTKDKAEVFTPCWVCNKQNNMVDERWFGRKSIFNIETNFSWIINEDKIIFDEDGQYTWMKYVDNKRLEITCGEAPYLVSRYDTVTGESNLEFLAEVWNRSMFHCCLYCSIQDSIYHICISDSKYHHVCWIAMGSCESYRK